MILSRGEVIGFKYVRISKVNFKLHNCVGYFIVVIYRNPFNLPHFQIAPGNVLCLVTHHTLILPFEQRGLVRQLRGCGYDILLQRVHFHVRPHRGGNLPSERNLKYLFFDTVEVHGAYSTENVLFYYNKHAYVQGVSRLGCLY